ncbi:hypothetical protein HOF65_07810 [bacterium]|jgi:hypothetical protein|nr:hypothetical protein [bacterium]MBT3853799.1 hypothetical protein [bacterium]MBT4632773.1 hypothetical protein [bacterium]MBT6779367.1 hypothetical protein [bacterium]
MSQISFVALYGISPCEYSLIQVALLSQNLLITLSINSNLSFHKSDKSILSTFDNNLYCKNHLNLFMISSICHFFSISLKILCAFNGTGHLGHFIKSIPKRVSQYFSK